MSAVRNRIKQVLCLLLAGPVISALLAPFFHHVPVEPKLVISVKFCIPCRVKLCGFEQLREVVCICPLQQALVREVIALY